MLWRPACPLPFSRHHWRGTGIVSFLLPSERLGLLLHHHFLQRDAKILSYSFLLLPSEAFLYLLHFLLLQSFFMLGIDI